MQPPLGAEQSTTTPKTPKRYSIGNNKQNESILTKSEFDEIAQRIQNSLPGLSLVRSLLQAGKPIKDLRRQAEDACQRVTIKVKVLCLHKQKSFGGNHSFAYRVDVLDAGW